MVERRVPPAPAATTDDPARERRVGLLLDGLDPEQRHAVTTPSRTLVIRAAAGAGKTRVLTRRVAYRDATDDLDPRRTLCVTFTREAAAELRNRLRALGLRDLPAAGTFHGIASAMLRARWHDQRMAVPTILTDRRDFLARADRRLGRDPARLARVVAEIDWARARGLTGADYPLAARRARRRPGVEPEVVVGAFEAYEVAKRAARVVDFDDLLERCADAFERDPAFAAAQRWRFQHLFVDEFQDVNPVQFRLLQAWLGERRDLCAVGDPNQAIYGWNGADPTLFDRVGELLATGNGAAGGVEIVELATNHRSTPQVVRASAAALGAGAAVRPGAARAPGAVPRVVACEDEADEAATIVAALRRWHDRGVRWSEQAVLVRTNALARSMRSALAAAGLPVVSPFLGGTHPLVTALPDASTWTDLLDSLEDLGGEAAAEISVLASEYADLDLRPTPAGFAAWLRTIRTTSRSTGPAGTDRGPGRGAGAADDAVTVATFHAAKGREWRAVVVAALEHGIVPLAGSSTPGSAPEAEERRLCYVALSRATEFLVATWASTRTIHDVAVARQPSPYLAPVSEVCRQLVAADRPAPPPRGLLVRRADHGADPEIDSPVTSRQRALERWRARRARAAGVAPGVVLADGAIAELAADPPASLDELRSRPSIGPIVADRFGPELLAALDGTDRPGVSGATR